LLSEPPSASPSESSSEQLSVPSSEPPSESSIEPLPKLPSAAGE
jgi:hypothetical protein